MLTRETERDGLKEQTKMFSARKNQGKDKSLKKKALGGKEEKRKNIRQDQSINHKLKTRKKRKNVSKKR